MKYLPLLFLLVIAHYAGYAQYTDSTHYYVCYQASGSVNKTNTSRAYLLNNGFKFGLRQKDFSLNLAGGWVYGRQNQGLTNNDFQTTLDCNLYKTLPHFFYWGLVNYTTSYSLKINNQFQAGAGVAYSLLDWENTYLNVSDGVLFDRSELFLPDSTSDSYHTFRNSLRLSFRLTVKDRLVLNGVHFLQNSFSDGSDYIIRSATSLSFKVKKWLSLTAALGYNRQNRTGSENLLVTYGLTVEKYF